MTVACFNTLTLKGHWTKIITAMSANQNLQGQTKTASMTSKIETKCAAMSWVTLTI
jgi:hypothetical protein